MKMPLLLEESCEGLASLNAATRQLGGNILRLEGLEEKRDVYICNFDDKLLWGQAAGFFIWHRL